MAFFRSVLPTVLLTSLAMLPACQTRSFSPDALAFVHPGETLRSEVIENLGPPSWEASNGSTMAYIRSASAGKTSQWALRREQSLPLVTTTTTEFGQRKTALCFAYDVQGHVTRMEVIPIAAGTDAATALEAWSRAGK
jgi:hypothetical protein